MKIFVCIALIFFVSCETKEDKIVSLYLKESTLVNTTKNEYGFEKEYIKDSLRKTCIQYDKNNHLVELRNYYKNYLFGDRLYLKEIDYLK